MRRPHGDTRTAILAAAASEFASHGFAGASVDDIAARARVNKAMIYYHFGSKKALYVEILRDVFRLMGARTAAIVAAELEPAAKVEAFIAAFDHMASTHPYMPPMMMREMAEGAVRLDTDTLRLLARILENLKRVLDEGAAAGAFRPASPLLTYLTMVGPVIFFHATAPIRAALGKSRLVEGSRALDPEAFVAYLKAVALAFLESGASSPAPPRTARPRPRANRSGDHA